jgi:2-polyprenyl-6-methoxyphenol hydroxylase-like FAD-dependent oxidoreductase
VVVGRQHAEFDAYRKDIEGTYLETIARVPSFHVRIKGAKREERFMGGAVANFFRKPHGPGWALVGDAGYNKDPITAQGIMDAFHDAERCASALDDALAGRRTFDAAMADYHRVRDEHALPMYDFTCQLAALEPPPPELQQVLGALQGNAAAMDAFAQMNAGTISPAAFFSPANLGPIMATAS